MTTPRPNSRAEQRRRTEARILGAASQVFVEAGYERTTIRAVAAAADVDPGLVMHYFGSKQELFRRVLDSGTAPEVDGTPEQVTEQILASLADRLANAPTASLAMLRSMLTNEEAASVARAGMARYEEQIERAIPAADASLRAAIISAVILGVTVSRHLVKADDLASADPARVIALLRPCLLALAAQSYPMPLTQRCEVAVGPVGGLLLDAAGPAFRDRGGFSLRGGFSSHLTKILRASGRGHCGPGAYRAQRARPDAAAGRGGRPGDALPRVYPPSSGRTRHVRGPRVPRRRLRGRPLGGRAAIEHEVVADDEAGGG